jgi:3-oxoacyl-(acyl-carrier-protein) synthase
MNNIREELDIAIVGLSGRFPGANNCNEFWHNLLTGEDQVSRFSVEELIANGHSASKVNEDGFVPVNGVLEDADKFDSSFFGYGYNEAEVMDPQTRLMLQCVWHALENAGVNPNKGNRNIGLFLGARSTVQWTMQAMMSEHMENVGGFLASQLSNKDAMSTLISWKLGLQGPSYTLQTACSTSLVSVHQAAQSLLNGECDYAVAGGVSLLLPQQNGHIYQEGMLFSKDGKTRTFDENATGSVFGSGLGAVVLRRAEDALADRDPIWAILKSSAINNDGNRKVGYTAPSVDGQAEVINAALELAEMTPADLDYIECHGTATALGDSIELMALSDVFRGQHEPVQPGKCALGAVKSTIGHLDSAAGIAGFIKAVLAVNKGIIPPTAHFELPNGQLGFEASPFYVNTQAQVWETEQDRPRVAGVSSFGIGGTNAHTVIQQYVPQAPNTPPKYEDRIFIFSAKTRSSLLNNIAEFSRWLLSADDIPVAAVQSALAKRHVFAERLVFIANSLTRLDLILRQFLQLPNDQQTSTTCTEWLDSGQLQSEQRNQIRLWLDGESDTFTTLQEQIDGCVPWHNLPGYCFEPKVHGLHHIDDERWQRIAATLRGNAGVEQLDKNAAGFLIPYWRPLVLPMTDETSTGQLVAFVDDELSFNLDDMRSGQQTIAWHEANLNDIDSIQSALRSVVLNRQQGQDLVLNFILPARKLSLQQEAYTWAAEFGRCLSHLDISTDAQTHIYFTLVSDTRDQCPETAEREALTSALFKAIALVLPQEVAGIRASFIKTELVQPALLATALRKLMMHPQVGPLKLAADGLFVEDFRHPDSQERCSMEHSELNGKLFVISGATGQMAKAMARHIAEQYQGKLALLTRQDCNLPEFDRWKQTLEEAGAKQVVWFEESLSDHQKAMTTFKKIEAEMGEITHLIHTAGVTDGDSFAAISEVEPAHYYQQLSAKALSTNVLRQVFAEIAVKYCYLTSSMSCFFGGLAHVTYATANLFLDEWVSLNRLASNTQWIGVNWETIHFSEQLGDKQTWGANEIAINGKDFNAFFDASMRQLVTSDRKIISGGDFEERLYRWAGHRRHSSTDNPQNHAASTKLHTKLDRTNLSTSYVSPENSIQRDLVDIWGGILSISQIGTEDIFIEIGGDSLKTVVMAEQVYKKLGKRFSVPEFFKNPTIKHIETQLMEQEAPSSSGEVNLRQLTPPEAVPLSTDQEMIYMHQAIFKDSSYNMPTAFDCADTFSVQDICDALRRLVRRHYILHAMLVRDGKQVKLRPDPKRDLDIKISRASGSETEDLLFLTELARTACMMKHHYIRCGMRIFFNFQ